MKKLRRILFLALMVGLLACLCCQPAFAAVSEEEVQAQVDAVGKETVSGNVLIWFMCAIGFLKVSQKIDSFMASLGVNVGHTGGSMLAEALIAARGFSGFKSFSSHHFGGGHSSNSTHVNASGGGKGGGFGAGFASGGLAGVIGRKVTNNAVKTATTPSETKASGLGGLVGSAAGGIGGHIYTSSVSKGGNFANNVIGSVATGNITQMGTISGEKAVDALHSYMGHAALEAGAENIPQYQNVEIGGGRITGTEVTDVITTVTLRTDTDLTPDNPASVTFSILGTSYRVNNIVIPAGDSQKVWVKWHTPSTPQTVTITVSVSGAYTAQDTFVAKIVDLNEHIPPDPVATDTNSSYTLPSLPSETQKLTANWGVWSCYWVPVWVWCDHGEDGGHWVDEGYWEYGPSGMSIVFLVSAVCAMPIILMIRRIYLDRRPLSIPFLPFLACGCSAATLAELFLH